MNVAENIPWVEKYRPRSISKILEQNEIIQTLKECIENSLALPHCLFYGPPGTGKTTTALAIAYQLFGPKYFKERILELNASDERGIKVVREKIKTFARRRINDNIPKDYNFKCPPYKVIILDEADAMTDESQFALRRIIEENSLTTRFFLICNFVARINKPIISRCAIYRFKNLSNDAITNQLNKICKKEKINITNKSINKIIDYCDGDLRKAINTLQRLKFLSVNEINDDILNDISIKINLKDFSNLINKLETNISYQNIINITRFFMKNGYGGNIILREMSKKIISTSKLNELQKSMIFLKLSKLDHLLNNGSDEELIIINFLTYFSYVLNNYN
jgi:replication factor C subunit 2/4